MNYLLLNSEFYFSEGTKIVKIENGPHLKEVLNNIEEINVCVVDVDVELAAAPEAQEDKKDSILARKFSKLHPQNEYILQDERIDENIFQVIGVKTDKIREVYSLIPSNKVRVFIPYAIAIRIFLIKKNFNLTKGIIFIDELEDERLVTVFSGLKFSVTRVLTTHDVDNILSEVKRSQIGFSKKIEGFENYKTDRLNVLTNSQYISSYPLSIEQNINLEYINVKCPAIEGLKDIEISDSLVKFLLPEHIKGEKRKHELKEKALSLFLSSIILAAGICFLLINQIKLGYIKSEYTRINHLNSLLEGELAGLDLNTYRNNLKEHEFINYANPYLKILNILPSSYEIYSFRYYQTDHWNLEAFIISKDGGTFDEIPKFDILRNAVINDYLIKGRPGKRIQIDL